MTDPSNIFFDNDPDPIVQEVKNDVRELQGSQVTYREMRVTAVDPETSTFSAIGEGDPEPTIGIWAPVQFLPGLEDTVTVTVAGATPIYQPNGVPQINSDRILNVSGLNVSGEVTIGGTPLGETLDNTARVVARTKNWANPGSTTTELGMIELAVEQTIPGHLYKIEAHGMIAEIAGADDQTVRWWARYTTDGSAPTITSPHLATDHTYCRFDLYPYESTQAHLVGEFTETSATPRTLRVGLSFAKPTGASSVSLYTDDTLSTRVFTITDMGVDPGDTGQVNYMAGGGAPSAPPGSAKTYQEKFYPATWGRIFDQSGAIRTDGPVGWQGYSVNWGGRSLTQLGFDSTAIFNDLLNADIVHIKLYTYWNWWSRENGGHPAVSTHGNASAPGSPSGIFANEVTTFPTVIPRMSGYWFTLPSSWHASFKSGAYKGVVLGPGPFTNDDIYLGKFDGPGTVNYPRLAIGFRK